MRALVARLEVQLTREPDPASAALVAHARRPIPLHGTELEYERARAKKPARKRYMRARAAARKAEREARRTRKLESMGLAPFPTKKRG